MVPGDILVRYNGDRLDGDPETLRRVVRAAPAGRPVVLEALRGAARVTFEVQGGALGIRAVGLLPASVGAAPAEAPSSAVRP